MFFIIVTTASTLGAHGIKDIQTADQAASALRPFAGDFAFCFLHWGSSVRGFWPFRSWQDLPRTRFLRLLI